MSAGIGPWDWVISAALSSVHSVSLLCISLFPFLVLHFFPALPSLSFPTVFHSFFETYLSILYAFMIFSPCPFALSSIVFFHAPYHSRSYRNRKIKGWTKISGLTQRPSSTGHHPHTERSLTWRDSSDEWRRGLEMAMLSQRLLDRVIIKEQCARSYVAMFTYTTTTGQKANERLEMHSRTCPIT